MPHLMPGMGLDLWELELGVVLVHALDLHTCKGTPTAKGNNNTNKKKKQRPVHASVCPGS